ncbi:PAS domain-containing protein [Caulobacter sp. KR2-114]|uniref:PAS domain-containing protein n=1 Tax=Caulobacter sp. KR2-114 TaxID=3400912 RepID=UPI003C077659
MGAGASGEWLFESGGEAGALMARLDWSATPLGPPQTWSETLRSAVRMLLPSRAQIVVFWGPEYVALYNDAYAPAIGEHHPRALGRPAQENWSELWDDLEPMLRRVRERGETVEARDRPFYVERKGYGEQVNFDISYSAVRGPDGAVEGVLCIVSETTERLRAQETAEEERRRLAGLFEQAPGFMAILREPGHVFELTNRAYQQLIGHRDVIGRSLADALPEVQGQGFVDLMTQVVATGEAFRGEAVTVDLQRTPGAPLEPRILDFLYQPILGEDGAVSAVFVQGHDVTDRVSSERARRESEGRLRLAAEAADIGTWDLDPVTGELRWDDRCRRMFGLPPGAPVTYEETFLGGLHPQDRGWVSAAVDAALATGGSGGYDVEYRTVGLVDRVERWVAAKGRAIFDDGRAVRFIGTVVDISERKRAAAALAASELALREEGHALEILNRTAANVAAELNLDRLVQTVVDAGVELTGARFGAFFYNVVDDAGESYMLYALSGAPRSAFERFPMPRNTAVFAPTFAGEGVVRSDDILADPRYGHSEPYRGMPKGHLPVRSYLAVPVTSRSGEVIGGFFFGHEETGVFDERAERLVEGLAGQAAIGIDNARLYQAELRLNRTLEAQVAERTQERDRIWQVSQDLLGVTDARGVWRSVNPAWTRILGREPEEILGRGVEWLQDGADLSRADTLFALAAAGDRASTFETRLLTRQGEVRTIAWTAVPSHGELYCVGRDVTEERRQADALAEAEAALRQSQKMETVGQLTGGVAHDFNNLLQIVTGNLDTLLRRLPEDSPRLRRAAENAMTGAQRAVTLTQRLLAFSRRQPLAPKPTDLNRLVSSMSELLHRTLGETIDVETVLAAGAWPVEIDANQLENAILNLALNARDAMDDGGKLTIETGNTYLDREYAGSNMEVAPGQYAMISVSDTGSGMSPETLLRVFEPFFTTKEVGRGTGLGLSMVYGFVKQSGGHVKVYSEVGVGTTVKIYLPRLVGAEAVADEVQAPLAPEGTRDETILVCEDDDDVRAYSVEMLRELGYRVLEAHDGPSALRLLQRQEGRVDLLFTDVVLPGGMTGAVLAREARALRPDVKVLFTTGYARNAIVHHGRLDPGVELLTKPFAYADLAARVRDLLDGA